MKLINEDAAQNTSSWWSIYFQDVQQYGLCFLLNPVHYNIKKQA